MADFADIASENEELFRDEALKSLKNNNNKESAEFCKVCGDEIPFKRRKAIKGCDMCLECQMIKERGF